MSIENYCDKCGESLLSYSSATLKLFLGCYHGKELKSKRFVQLFKGDLCPGCGELLKIEARKAVKVFLAKPIVAPKPKPKKIPWYKRFKSGVGCTKFETGDGCEKSS